MDLLFTKGINLEEEKNYESPVGKNDHVILEIEIMRNIQDKQKESAKSKNYKKNTGDIVQHPPY